MKRMRVMLCLLLILLLLPRVSAAEAESKTEALHSLFTTADLMDATVAELLAAMEAGRLTSVQLTQMYLDRIEAYDQSLELNSIISINPDALEEAEAADAARASGEPLGRLHGIPVIVKDNIDVAGMATTSGDVYRSNDIAFEDAEVVARLKAEGAIILAKANMSLNAQSGNSSYSTIAGSVHNAYDITRTPAGSSGGTAVAITCNFAAIGLGSDTASSIRRPSSFANLYGLRPSHGLVSQYGLDNLAPSKDVIGPMCRTAEDLALLLDIIAGSDSKDAYTAEADSYLPESGYTACLDENGLEGKRIGYLANSFGYYYSIANGLALSAPTEPDEKIVAMYEAAKTALAAGGAELVDLSEALTEVEISSMRFDTTTAGRLYFRNTVTSRLEELDIDAVLYVSQTDVPEPEPYASETPNNEACYINIFGPLAGLPDIVLPMGLSDTDADTPYPLALGLSLFAGYGNDGVLIEIAYAYEQLTDVRVQPWTTPALPDPALAAFAETLISDSKVLLNESGEDEALRGALDTLEGLTMEAADEADMRTVVDAITYYDAAERLAAAYDARRAQLEAEAFLAAEEAIAPAPAQTEAPLPEGIWYDDDQAPAEKSVDLAAILVVCFAISVPVAAILYTRIKKSKNETTNV